MMEGLLGEPENEQLPENSSRGGNHGGRAQVPSESRRLHRELGSQPALNGAWPSRNGVAFRGYRTGTESWLCFQIAGESLSPSTI